MKNLISRYGSIYFKWKETPEGKTRLEEIRKRFCIEIPIKNLPYGWVKSSFEEDGYFKYSNDDLGLDVIVDIQMDNATPIMFGGKQSFVVTVEGEIIGARSLEDEDIKEELFKNKRVICKFSAEKDWKTASQKANECALKYMRD